jgi:hypothetical protein
MFPSTLNTNDPDAVHRFIGGRRHYNAVRRFRAHLRQREVARLLLVGYSQAEIARTFGVHRSTISRDVMVLYEAARREGACPVCGKSHRLDLVRLEL